MKSQRCVFPRDNNVEIQTKYHLKNKCIMQERDTIMHAFIPDFETLYFATQFSVYSEYPGCVGNSIFFELFYVS